MVPGDDENAAGKFFHPFAVIPANEFVESELENGKKLQEIGQSNGQHNSVEDSTPQIIVD
jgi:hypothetical protein